MCTFQSLSHWNSRVFEFHSTDYFSCTNWTRPIVLKLIRRSDVIIINSKHWIISIYNSIFLFFQFYLNYNPFHSMNMNNNFFELFFVCSFLCFISNVFQVPNRSRLEKYYFAVVSFSPKVCSVSFVYEWCIENLNGSMILL